jgi:ubiquinone/menaquinone biosynthesis C-methylase UbiE
MREALSIEKLRNIYRQVAKRYDLQHAIITARADQRGRRILLSKTVREGDKVLDCGAGTGTTGIMAAEKAGPHGKVTFFDLSEDMLAVAREKAARLGFLEHVIFQSGDMVHLPFDDDSFDVVLSTYSLCPLYNPEKGALELYRVTKRGGKIGVAHTTEPRNPVLSKLANKIEDIVWPFPWISLGCRSISVLPGLEKAGGRIIFEKQIGVPLWPFLVFVIEKPLN